jgi:dTDP-4-dehydrorhamnose reductase
MTFELWAGAECTINRVGDRYFDQSARSGHYGRLSDIDRMIELGVKRVRFPVLLERVAPDGLHRPDFTWQDACLERLCAAGVEPILGLVHHGSGPRHASLETDAFEREVAAFAAMVAQRYPWARTYTPINEPLTTARFSGLYGHWYPHGRDTATFLRVLLNEISATAAAMRAIRAVTPDAQLLQTEDCGRTYGTDAVAAQWEYENSRRWLTFDLLTGQVTREHPLRGHLEAQGIRADELDELAGAPCPPDILGINYYVTSDRFLDHRIERYPKRCHGGNAFIAYADVEAVRVRRQGIAGFPRVLSEAWSRYHIPVALTEVHLGCTHDEQLRWLAEAWAAASQAEADGIDVRGVTLWSMFGSFDWSSLVTEDRGDYESGVFDVRSGTARPTPLAQLAQELARGAQLSSANYAGAQPGWWRQPSRLCYPPCVHGESTAHRYAPSDSRRGP